MPDLSTLKKLINKPDKPDAGYHTAMEWAVKWKTSIASTQRVLKKAVDQKIMRKRVFRIECSNRAGLYPVPHYAFTGKG